MVAELLGIKTFLNEFVAYAKFSEYIKNRELERVGRTISVSCTVHTMCIHACDCYLVYSLVMTVLPGVGLGTVAQP